MTAWRKTLTAKNLSELETLVNLQQSVKPVGVVTEGGRGYRVTYVYLEPSELPCKYKINKERLEFERM